MFTILAHIGRVHASDATSVSVVDAHSLVYIANTLTEDLGYPIPYIELPRVHRLDIDHADGMYARSRGSNAAEIQQLDACRRVAVDAIGGALALVETHHRGPDGVCIESAGALALPIQVPDSSALLDVPTRHRGRAMLELACRSSGMECEIRLGPSSLDLSGVRTVRGMLDRAVVPARSEGLAMTFYVKPLAHSEDGPHFRLLVLRPLVLPDRVPSLEDMRHYSERSAEIVDAKLEGRMSDAEVRQAMDTLNADHSAARTQTVESVRRELEDTDSVPVP